MAVPVMQFNPYNPLDTAIQTALGTYKGIGEGREQQAKAQQEALKAREPGYMIGGDAATLAYLMNNFPGMAGMGAPSGMGDGQGVSGMGAPVQQPSGLAPTQGGMSSGPQNSPSLGMTGYGQPDFGSRVVAGAQGGGMPQGGMSQAGLPGAFANNLAWKMFTPEPVKQGQIAAEQLKATLPLQVELEQQKANIGTGAALTQKSGEAKIANTNEAIDTGASTTYSADKALELLDVYEQASNQMNLLAQYLPVSAEHKESISGQARLANKASNDAINFIYPALVASGVMTQGQMDQAIRSQPSIEGPPAQRKHFLEFTKNLIKRQGELNNFTQYMVAQGKDGREIRSLWVDYNHNRTADINSQKYNPDNMGSFVDWFESKHRKPEAISQGIGGYGPAAREADEAAARSAGYKKVNGKWVK